MVVVVVVSLMVVVMFMIVIVVVVMFMVVVMVMLNVMFVIVVMGCWWMVMAFMIAFLGSGNKSSYRCFLSFWSRMNQAAILIKIIGIADPRILCAPLIMVTIMLALLCRFS